MKKYTAQTLTDEGYTIENAQITNVSLQPQITAASLLILLSKLPAGVLFTAVTALAKSTPTAMKKILMKVLPSVWRLSCASWMSSVFPVWKT